MKQFKKAFTLTLCLILSIPQSSFSQTQSFDFSDEPDYVYSGDDHFEGRDDGNCIGGGCSESRGDDGSRGQHEHEGAEDGRESPWVGREDSYDHVSGGAGYHQGSNGSRERAEGENWTDHSDIFYGDNGKEYVKSRDGKSMLPISGLRDCARQLNCTEKGYKEQWWNYSSFPGETSDEAQEYWDDANFAKSLWTVKKGIERASALPRVKNSPSDLLVLEQADMLHREARDLFLRGDRDEANDFLEASIQIVGLFVDLGISFTPAGWARDVYEFMTGRSLVHGTQLTHTERVLAGIGVIVPAVGSFAVAGIKILNKGAQKSAKARAVVDTIDALSKIKVPTPNGFAFQEISKGAISARISINSETKLYRIGTRNVSKTGSVAQYWSLEYPLNPGYAARYGIPAGNVAAPNFIEIGRIKPTSEFVTRSAPGVGANGGGGIEVVVSKGGVIIDGHHSL